MADAASAGNRFLGALPERDRRDLLARARPLRLEAHDVLFSPGARVDEVWLLDRGLVSLVAVADGRAAVEAAMVGREGIVGVPMVFDARRASSMLAITQVEGSALVVPVADFLSAFDRSRALRGAVAVFTQALFGFAGQNAACNRLHRTHERLARWLLMTQDRVMSDDFALTHDFLSQMLGARRASVTEAAGLLQEAGVIRYRRGQVAIVDRPGLQALACDCYGIVRAIFEDMYSPGPLQVPAPDQ